MPKLFQLRRGIPDPRMSAKTRRYVDKNRDVFSFKSRGSDPAFFLR